VGIPLQGSPGTLHTLFIVCMLSSFVPHCCSVLRLLSYVVRTLSYAVRLCLYVIVVCMSLLFGPLYIVIHHSLSFVCCHMLFVRHCLYVVVRCSYVIIHHSSLYVVIHHSSSFVCCPCGNVPRNIVKNSLLVKDKKDERYKKTRLGPK
jgi:hypothetical protein